MKKEGKEVSVKNGVKKEVYENGFVAEELISDGSFSLPINVEVDMSKASQSEKLDYIISMLRKLVR